MTFDKTRTAVVAIHFENDIVTKEGAFGPFFIDQVVARDVIAQAGRVISAAREAAVPVFYTRVGWDEGHRTLVANSPLLKMVAEQKCLVNGTWQTEIVPELAPADGDYVITHERTSSLQDSPLDVLLRARGVDTILIFGVATNASVEDTARHAGNLGYRVILIDDASSAATEEIHQATLGSMGLLAEVSTVAEVLETLAS